MDDFDDITCEEFYSEDCYEPCEPDNWADGDALASAGFGTDEDYVYDNDYFDDVPF